MRTTQGARANRGWDAGILTLRDPRRVAHTLTLILERRNYLLRWTKRGPVALWRPSRQQRRTARRASEKVRARRALAKFKESRGHPLSPVALGRPRTRPTMIDLNDLPREFRRPFGESVGARDWSKLQLYLRNPLPQAIARTRWLGLQEEEVEAFRGTSLSAEISRAAEDVGVSRSTLDRLLHGKLKRLSWKTIRVIRRALTTREWAELRVYLWPLKRPAEYERYLDGPTSEGPGAKRTLTGRSRHV